MIPSPEVIVTGDEGFSARGALEILGTLREALAKRDRAFVALAGGATPRPVYRALVGFSSKLMPAEWRRVHFFWGDERLVPRPNERSNVTTATEDLSGLGALPVENLHVPALEFDPQATAAGYEKGIRSLLPSDPGGAPRFDLVLLGVGADGHTASLFPGPERELPGSDSVDARNGLVLATRSPVAPRDRISFSYELIAAARSVLVLAEGAGKADIVCRALRQKDGSLPVNSARPRSGRWCWLLDREAAAGLAI